MACPLDHGCCSLPPLKQEQEGTEPPGYYRRGELGLSKVTKVDAGGEKVLVTHTLGTGYWHFLYVELKDEQQLLNLLHIHTHTHTSITKAIKRTRLVSTSIPTSGIV